MEPAGSVTTGPLTMRSFLWLSFDLGIRGDFEGMYEFLDTHEAKECGDSFAAFWFEYRRDLLAELVKELRSAVAFDKRSRVYVVYPTAPGKTAGKFVVGKRRAPPWSGFGVSQGEEEDSGE
jgi:hypothetical protein